MDHAYCPIALNAKHFPDDLAIIDDERSYTYRELDCIITHLTEQLKEKNIGFRSTVAFIATTSPLTIALLFSLFRLQATACPLSHRLPPAHIATLLEQLGTNTLLDPNTLAIDTTTASISEHPWDLDYTATCLLTSGSSGSPKIACHCLANHAYNALGAIPALGITKTSRYLHALPLFHVSGISILMRSFLTASTIVLTQQPMSVSLNAHQITHASLVPTQLYRLLQDPSSSFPHLTCALIGGAALSATLSDHAIERGIPIYVTYGMTEMSSMVLCRRAAAEAPLSGALLTHREIQCADTGELYVRGETLFKGYWNPLTQTAELPLTAGWFATGDMGRQLPDGSWILTGRKDRLFISGGENIQPEEIEQALCRLPGILAARVVPQIDLEFGQRPVAYILENERTHTLESIREGLKELLPSFKHPVVIHPFTAEMLEGKAKSEVKHRESEQIPASCDPSQRGQS